MSTNTATPTPTAPVAPANPPDAVIEQRLRQARRHVKGVDLAAGLLRLAVGVLIYLLIFAVADHWLVAGGLGYLGRLLAALVLFGGAGFYIARELVPPCRFRIHPLFAAQALERGRPGVKNSLINFLMLREHRQELQPVVFDTVQRRAAADLREVEIEAAVERAHVFRLGYLLAGVLALCCLYLVLSPKSLATSAGRVLWPFSRTPAPTRVQISEVEPGNTAVYLGDTMTVTAVARGLRDEEPVTLYYSTSDGQLVNQTVPMTLPERDYRHRAELPPGGRGFQQDATYVLAAGDFRSEPFRIGVQTAPAIVVDRVVLEYPPYTGLPPRTLRRQGDLQALEGTRAIIYAEANQPIGRAEIDLGSDGKHGVRMKVDDRQAVGAFTLRLNPEDPSRPQHDNYQLRFIDTARRANPRPIRHRIEVIRDLPPEVVLLEPKQQQSTVPADGQVTIRVRAEDPDFGLRRVVLRAVTGGRDLDLRPLLAESAAAAGFRGPFTGEFKFLPREYGLAPGDRVLYWAEAEDIRQPTPGRAETDRRWLEVTEAAGRPDAERGEPTPADRSAEATRPDRSDEPQQPPFDQSEQPAHPEEEPGQEPPEKPSPDDALSPETPQPDDDQPTEPADGEGADREETMPGGRPEADGGTAGDGGATDDATPIDPDTNPGDAIERILEHHQRQQAAQPEPAEPQPPGEQAADPRPGDHAADDSPQPPDQPGGEPREPDEGQAADRQPERTDDAQPGEGRQPDEAAQPDRQPGTDQQPADADQPSGQPEADSGPPSGQPEAAPGESPPGAEPSETASEGGLTDDASEQEPGQMQPSPESGDSGAQREPGTPGTQQEPGPEEPSDAPSEPGSAEQTGGETSPSPQREPTQPGGDPQDGGIQGDDQMQEQSPGAGKPSEQPGGSPSPQEDNLDRPKTPGQVDDQEPAPRDEQSPSISKKQSDTEGDTAGDRSGGGEEGGGQQADQPGVGSPGTQTDAESGADASPQPGDGETGDGPGDQVEADGPTGTSVQRPHGSEGTRGEPGGQQPGEGPQKPSDGSSPPGQGMEEPTDGGQPGEQVSEGPGAHGEGSPTQGGAPDPRKPGTADQPPGEPGAEEAHLEFARKQTQLALEYLKDQVDQPNSDLLDQLGWSESEARRFIDQWEQLRRRAGRDDAEGRQARRSLDQALQSLGLRPRGTELKRDATPVERIDGIREGGRFRPPSSWAEQFEAYTRSIAEGER